MFINYLLQQRQDAMYIPVYFWFYKQKLNQTP